MFPNLAYIWYWLCCVCAAQHKQQESVSSSQDAATQTPAGFSWKSQLQTQGKLRCAQVTSPRHGQSPVGGTWGRGLAPSWSLPIGMQGSFAACLCWGEGRLSFAPQVTEHVVELLFLLLPTWEAWRRGPGLDPCLAGSKRHLSRLCSNPKEAFALSHAYRPQT